MYMLLLMYISPVYAQNATNATSRLFGDVQIFSVDGNGAELPLKKIVVKEYVSKDVYPFYPIIYFGQNDSTCLSNRLGDKGWEAYQEMLALLRRDSSFQDGFQTNYCGPWKVPVLSFLGQRLQQYPKAKITLKGYNDDIEGSEKGKQSLSLARAEAVKQYLVIMWEINPNRIKTIGAGSKKYPLLADTEEPLSKKRCVEILSDAPELLDAVVVEDTIVSSDPKKIRFRVKKHTLQPILDWSLRISCSTSRGEKILKYFHHHSWDISPRNFIHIDSVINWEIEYEPHSLPRESGKMSVEFVILDTTEVEHTFELTQPDIFAEYYSLKQQQILGMNEKRSHWFELLAFPLNSTSVSAVNKSVIKKHILPHLTKDSKILIEGFANASENSPQNLAEKRANEIAKLLPGKKTSLGIVAQKIWYRHSYYSNRPIFVHVLSPIPAAK